MGGEEEERGEEERENRERERKEEINKSSPTRHVWLITHLLVKSLKQTFSLR